MANKLRFKKKKNYYYCNPVISINNNNGGGEAALYNFLILWQTFKENIEGLF